MVRIGVVDIDSFEKIAGAIRSVYSLKSSPKHFSRDYSVEFADDIFFSSGCIIPYVTNMMNRGIQLAKPNVVIINSIDKDRGFELSRDYSAVLVNTDDIDIFKHLNIKNGNIITYGLNSKSSVTASSIRENSVTVCIQRAIPSLAGAKIEQQEFNVTVSPKHKENVSHMLAAVTAALIDDLAAP